MNKKQKVVVVGNGMVGHKFLESMVEKGARENFELITFCEEPRVAYDRVHLSEYFSGKTAEDLSLVPQNYYEDNNIIVHLCMNLN